MKIQIPDDFDPEKIIRSGQCFRASAQPDGSFHFITGKNTLSLSPLGTDTWEADCTPYAWKRVWAPYFDLSVSYKSFRRSIPAKDHFLRAAAGYGKGIRILRQDPFEMLITFIISQRKSIPAIRSSVEKLCLAAGKEITKNGRTFYTFPSPSALGKLSVNELKNCSLGYRAAYIHATVRMIAREKISFAKMETLSDKELTEKLLLFPGAGIKVVNCISLFAYHRTAAAPVDVWIGRVIQKHYGGVSPFPSYGHAAGIFQQYMFFYAQAKKLK